MTNHVNLKHSIMKYGIIIIILLSMFQPSRAQRRLNLQECREMAIDYSKQLSIAEQQKEKAVWTKKEFRANYYPRLSASGMYFYNQKKQEYKLSGGYLPTYVPDESGSLQPNVIAGADGKPVMGTDGKPVFHEYAFLPDIPITLSLRGVYMAGVQLQQPIFMGGKVRAAHRAAKIGEELADENIRLNRSEVLVELEQAYWQYVRVQELVTVASKYKEVTGELVKNLEDARDAGMAPLNNVLKAQVKHNDALLQLQQAQHGQTLAGMNLCRLIGLDLNTSLELTDTLSGTITPGILSLPDDLSQRPDYNMLEKQVEMKQKEVNVIRSDFLPQVGVTAGYSYGGGLKLNGDDSHSASFSAMASVQIPIFNWGEGRNKVRVAKAEEEITRLNKEKLSEMMQLEIAGNRFKVKDAQTRVNLTRSALAQAQENLTVSRNQYDVGMETLTNLLEAQAQWQQAWSDWVDAKAALRVRETEYLKSLGRLD